MALTLGSSLFASKMFKNSPEDSQVLGFDGATQRPGTPSSFFTSFSETKYPTAAVEDITIGTENWDDEANVYAEDGSFTGTFPLNTAEFSYYLKVSDFNFTIPPGAIIKGIKVSIKRRSADAANAVKDYAVRIVKNGAIGTTNKAAAGYYPSWAVGFGWAYYGSSTDLWGETWDADTINYDNFGVVISCINDAVLQDGAEIDVITIQVYYSG